MNTGLSPIALMNALKHTRHRRGVAFHAPRPAPWSPQLPGRLVRDFRRAYHRLGRKALREESHAWQLTLFLDGRFRPETGLGPALDPVGGRARPQLFAGLRLALLNCRRVLFGAS
ncbi:MAG: hypothetical protein ACT4O3_09540 [Elusimicrobiota bacterium]